MNKVMVQLYHNISAFVNSTARNILSTLSTPGWNTLSTPGWNTLSTPGWNTLSTPVWNTLSTPVWNTLSTPGWNTLSTPGWNTLSTPVWNTPSTPGWTGLAQPSGLNYSFTSLTQVKLGIKWVKVSLLPLIVYVTYFHTTYCMFIAIDVQHGVLNIYENYEKLFNL